MRTAILCILTVIVGCMPTASPAQSEILTGAIASNELAKDDSPNLEMQNLFMADQAIRLDVEKRGGWAKVKDDKAFLEKWAKDDSERLRRTNELLEMNALRAGIDFYRAAYIFQHSDKPMDYLKAHHLAVIAIAKGYDARWISAATMDRFLQSTGRKQIYGTQFRLDEKGEQVRQPVEPNVVSDQERALLSVPPLGGDR